MYIRLLAVNAIKKVPLHRVMAFENAPVPMSIFNEEGTVVSKTAQWYQLRSQTPCINLKS